MAPYPLMGAGFAFGVCMETQDFDLDFFLDVLSVKIAERDGNVIAVTTYGYGDGNGHTVLSETTEVILYGKASL